MTAGDAGPLAQLAASERTATFFGPRGGKVVGSQQVAAKYEQNAAVYQPGGETHFEVLQQVEEAMSPIGSGSNMPPCEWLARHSRSR